MDGLAELRRAFEARDAAYERKVAAVENEDYAAFGASRRASKVSAALVAQFPRAAAYLRAEAMSGAANSAKAAAYRKAAERIAAGEDCAAALSQADAEWSEAAARAVANA